MGSNRPAGRIAPYIDGNWWTIARNPDLGALGSEEQEPVDFAIWQARDATWQVLSCIRRTKEPGNTRLLFRWEGRQLTDTNFAPIGVVMRADTMLGETEGGLQAPYVLRHDGRFVMLYGDWEYICLATSDDGKAFTRRINPNGRTGMFMNAPGANTRDPMCLRIGGLWHCYYCAHPNRKGAVYCRTSPDLQTWSPEHKVAAGGAAGSEAYSAECPFVVQIEQSLYLFRTQKYGAGAITRVYLSRDPLYFGVNDDEGYLVTDLPIAAPEVFRHGGEWFIAALRPDLKGIQLARLAWSAE
jgi:hypothetical protein